MIELQQLSLTESKVKLVLVNWFELTGSQRSLPWRSVFDVAKANIEGYQNVNFSQLSVGVRKQIHTDQGHQLSPGDKVRLRNIKRFFKKRFSTNGQSFTLIPW